MKRFLAILVMSLFAVSTALSTEQIPDILIIGNDTIELESPPFQSLKIDGKVLKLPFQPWHTACWRGYIATWEVIDNNLTLKKINVGNETKFDIVEYLETNGYTPKTINGLVVADWYLAILRQGDLAVFYEESGRLRLREAFRLSSYTPQSFSKDYMLDNTEKFINAQLIFENGKLIENNIIPITDYKIGDKLSLLTYLNKKHKYTYIQGIIEEINGKMVKLEILPLDIRGKTIEFEDSFWVNPRYCEKIE